MPWHGFENARKVSADRESARNHKSPARINWLSHLSEKSLRTMGQTKTIRQGCHLSDRRRDKIDGSFLRDDNIHGRSWRWVDLWSLDSVEHVHIMQRYNVVAHLAIEQLCNFCFNQCAPKVFATKWIEMQKLTEKCCCVLFSAACRTVYYLKCTNIQSVLLNFPRLLCLPNFNYMKFEVRDSLECVPTSVIWLHQRNSPIS